jgi:AbrB family looped-hinge helix DNA binding protein
VDIAARLTSKGQLTVPKPVRDALGLEEGDVVFFRIEGKRAVLARSSRLLELAGSVSAPAARRSTSWDAQRRQAWDAQTRKRR